MYYETISVVEEGPNRSMSNMTVAEDEPLRGTGIEARRPIEFVTENGFVIVRLCELQTAIDDSETGCCFLVRQPNGEERHVSVVFSESVAAEIQNQRKSHLLAASEFWLTLAEEHLGTYLWKNNKLPADGHLVVSRVSGHDLALAARWKD